ncbi:collagen alpha-1(I) chain-like [Vulpes lagopus]|uniref:collagen alpha-1(I) chain-like n=1 Tax=Vulpes lagopus TaxID=494514 RepID=UPI001BC9129F|nr:collagen alpha-1(I) chain-like [Vulpes lagopus]
MVALAAPGATRAPGGALGRVQVRGSVRGIRGSLGARWTTAAPSLRGRAALGAPAPSLPPGLAARSPGGGPARPPARRPPRSSSPPPGGDGGPRAGALRAELGFGGAALGLRRRC